MSRSTITETILRWERTGGAHPGVLAEYGPWRFQVYRWQAGCYLASAHNAETGEHREFGANAGEVRSIAAGKVFCDVIFRRILAADRAAGITRE